MDKKWVRLKKRINNELKKRAIETTPQSLDSLTHCLYYSNPEYVGDSDTLLLGLLYSGSYTIDILENAGSSVDYIKNEAFSTATANNIHPYLDPLDSLFCTGSCGANLLNDFRGRTLHTSDILKNCIKPSMSESKISSVFPINKIDGKLSDSPILKELQLNVAEILTLLVYILNEADKKNHTGLSTRREPITDEEDWILDKNLINFCPDMTIEELGFCISALNTWFTKRKLLFEPIHISSNLIMKLNPLLFAPKQFISSGGDYKLLENGLKLIDKLVPERN